MIFLGVLKMRKLLNEHKKTINVLLIDNFDIDSFNYKAIISKEVFVAEKIIKSSGFKALHF